MNLNFIKYRMFVLEMKPIGVITNRLLFFEVHQMMLEDEDYLDAVKINAMAVIQTPGLR